jgi:hypothetical protein
VIALSYAAPKSAAASGSKIAWRMKGRTSAIEFHKPGSLEPSETPFCTASLLLSARFGESFLAISVKSFVKERRKSDSHALSA